MKTKILSLLITIFLISCSQVSRPYLTVTLTPSSHDTFPMISDVQRYKEVMDAFEHHPLVSHFPEIIPNNASQVQFVYQPRRMQGAMFVELLMTLPETDIQYIEDKYENIAKYKLATSEFSDDPSEPFLYLLRNEDHELDDQFMMFIIDVQPAGSSDMPWNHGQSSGIGINKTDSQVIYWAEYW